MQYAFILPTIALLGVFAYYPVFSALYHSVFKWDGVTTPQFVGLGNFRAMLHDPVMHAAAVNVAKLAVFNVFISVSVPLLVARAILSIKSLALQYFFRIVFVISLIIPNVVVYLIWQFLYDPNFGLLNRLITDLHVWQPQGWLGNPHEALYSLMVIGFPWVDAFALLIFTAGLQNIPRELLEAAQIDGSGVIRRFFRIELPLVMGQVKLIAVLNMIFSVQDFTTVLVLTQGGPGTATEVPGMDLYQSAFQNQEMGYACAIGTVLFLVMLIITYVVLRFVPSHQYDPEERRAT